jgi:signal transduction histidine kinase
MINLANLDLFLLGVTVAGVSILGLVIFLSNRQSATSRAFLGFTVATIFYGIVNYSNYQVAGEILVLWMLRLTIFSAVLHAFSFYNLFRIFPKDDVVSTKFFRHFVVPVTIFILFLSLTPFVFSGISELSSRGQASTATHEAGIALFGIWVTALVLAGLYKLVRKTISAGKQDRLKYRLVVLGALLTFSLIIAFNVVLPAAYSNTRFIPLAPLFFVPFISLTAYAIYRHNLLDVKVISTEILVFVLAAFSLSEIVFSQDINTLLLKVVLFLMVLTVGVLLIKSVVKEVKAREQIQKLKEQLEDANHELKQVDEAKSDFVSIASHQLRTPLTVIKGYMSMLNEGTFGQLPEPMKQPIDKAFKSSERLEDLVENLLSVSRIERGTMKYNFAPVDFVGLAKSVTEELRGAAEQKQLSLTFSATEKLPQVNIDEEKIRQIMLNLIDNAIKYTAHGNVDVKVSLQSPTTFKRLRKPSLVFVVSDTGDGVPKDIQPELFKKFVRGQNEVHIKGTGLGLYVGRMMVEAHKGQIWVESEGEGKGATFGFAIPTTTG